MPCKRCPDGKWKYGDKGRCQFDTLEKCRKAEAAIHIARSAAERMLAEVNLPQKTKAGLAKAIGRKDPGFFTACVAKMEGKVDDPKAFCNALHKDIIGKFPGKHRRASESLSFFNPEHDAKVPSREFLRALVSMVREKKFRRQDFRDLMRRARGKAGGIMSGRSRRMRKEQSKIDVSLEPRKEFCDTMSMAPPKPGLPKDHEAVQYRESEVTPEAVKTGTAGKHEEQTRCGACRYFTSYGTCHVVEGAIDAYYVCDLWEAPPRTFQEGRWVDIVPACDTNNGWSRLFFEIPLKAEAPAKSWIPYLPKPGTYSHPKYGDIRITPERNRRFLENFEERVYGQNIPIDIEHNLEKSGAMGYATKMRQNDDGSVDAFVEWTADGLDALGSGKYRYFSPQYLESWLDPSTKKTHTDVAIGGALTARPFFKEQHLRPLIAHEGGLVSFTETAAGNPMAIRFAPKEAAMTEKGKHEGLLTRLMKRIGFTGSEEEFGEHLEEVFDSAAIEAAEDDKKKKGKKPAFLRDEDDEEEDDMKMAEVMEQNKQLREAAEKDRAEVKSLTERVEKSEALERKRKFADIVRGFNEQGQYDPESAFMGSADDHVGFLMDLSKAFGEDSSQVKGYIERERVRAKQFTSSAAFAELGSARGVNLGGDAYAQLQVKAKELIEKGEAKSMNEALRLAEDRFPDLAKRYMEQLRG
jgi:hypothetical protein